MNINSKAPMIDLHRHLDGNIRVSSIIELAHLHNVKLPSTDLSNLSDIVHIKDKTTDLLAFLQKLDMGVSVLGNLQACKQIAYENVEDAVKEGLHHVELRFSPYYMSQAFNLPLQGVVEAVIEGVQTANKYFNFNATVIGILSRTFGLDQCMQELNALLACSKDLVAIDLAGDENGFPAKLFTKHFDKVKDSGLKVTIHAGEAAGPSSIWDAINLLHADRIGHGVSAYQDNKLMDFMAQNNIGIESCLLSNYQTGTWTDIAKHPVHRFLDNGIAVCLNTDDPGVSNNTLSSEYDLAKNVLALDAASISQLKNNALLQAFLPINKKDAIKASLL